MPGRILVFALIVGTTFGVAAQTPRPTFEVASVRKVVPQGVNAPTPPVRTSPDRFYRAGETLAFFVRLAYDVQSFQLVGGPDWVRNDRFTINAKASREVSPQESQLMLQSLLEERFGLVLRRDQREMRHLALVLARTDGQLGPSLQRCVDLSLMPELRPVPPPSLGYLLRRTCASLSDLIARGTWSMGTPVVDRTGLTGSWNYQLIHARPGPTISASGADAEPLLPFDLAVREQLGLRVETGRGLVDVLVIDSVQQPTEN